MFGLRLSLGALTIQAILGHPVFVPASVSSIPSAALLIAWCSWASPVWVRRAAEAYAERLIAACDSVRRKRDGDTVLRLAEPRA